MTDRPPDSHGPAIPDRLVISEEDLASSQVDRRVEELRAAGAPQLVKPVGAPPPAPPSGAASWFRTSVGAQLLAGLLGGALGWLLAEIVARPDSLDGPFADDPTMSTIIFVCLFGVGLATVLAGWEGIETRSMQKALPAVGRAIGVVLVGGLVGGFIAQRIIFEPLAEDAIREALRQVFNGASVEQVLEDLEAALRIPRAIAFLVVGTAIGVALGAASRTRERAINGALGGAVGGFLGGLLFSFVTTDGSVARLVALVITGGAVGAGIGLVEEARKELWLEIVSGGMAGKQFILYHDTTVIGSAPDCHVTLIKDPDLHGHHATLSRGREGPHLRAAGPDRPFVINGRAATEHRVSDGDQVQLGRTLVRFGMKAEAMPTLAAPL